MASTGKRVRAYNSPTALLPARRHRSVLYACLLLALALVPRPSRAAAPPVLEVTAEGQCPDAEALASAFRAHGCVMGPSQWQASVRRLPDAAEIELRNPSGQTVLERQIHSDDCPALAEAAALIVEAYFVQIGVMPPAAGTAPATSPEPVATPPAHAVPARSRPSTQPPRVAAPAPNRKRSDRTNAPSSHADRFGWHVTAGVGPRAEAPELHFAGGAELGMGLDMPFPALSADVRLATTLPVVVLSPPDRVRRWPSSALLRLGGRFGSAPVAVPWVGAGVSAVRDRAVDVPGATTRTKWLALTGLGIDGWWPLGSAWFAVTGVGCSLYVSREEYRIGGDKVGDGPLVDCGATLGASWAALVARTRPKDSGDHLGRLRSP